MRTATFLILTLLEWMPRTWQAFEELVETGRFRPYEKELIRPDGKKWWGLFAGTRLGKNEAMEFVIDITERKQAEEALQDNKILLEKTFYSLLDSLFIVDAETTRILDCNSAAAVSAAFFMAATCCFYCRKYRLP
ncbi:MAG: hypothetical protein R6U50_06295 [Desulfobacterales bacterium]